MSKLPVSEFVFESVEQKMREMNGYARTGNTLQLHSKIKNDPFILQKIDKIPFAHTPLHEAAATGQTIFAIEIMSLQPSLGRKLDPQGLSPLHLALKNGHKKMAISLVKFDKQLVRVRGFEGFTPLHYAARYYPDLDVLACFLLECQASINDLNSRFQSAVHLVMESENSKAIDLVLMWLVRTAREPVLGWKDKDSDTALHVAARHDCVEAVKAMVKIAKLNKRNSSNQTPLDVAHESGNKKVSEVLIKARAKKGGDLARKETRADYLCSGTNLLETGIRGYCFLLKDLTVEMRSVVLVVAILIATATYQAVLQPPGGVYPPDSSSSSPSPPTIRISGGRRSLGTPVPAPAPAPEEQSEAGKMVMESGMYVQFMPANTLAFTLSMVIIIFVLHGRPYNIILHGCLIFLAYSYLVAMESIAGEKEGGVAQLMFVLSWGVLSSAFGVKMLYYLVKALFEDVWWLPRCGVAWHNWSYRAGCPLCRRCMSLARNLRRQCKLIQRLEI
ncbi:Ankyrin repeat family protein [Striga hermonthica]|uniref:Ankyrin repeat family protein n=1 Tax=Striga hermonthica TaxID=68872 RepID=A0A9N7MV80_STRHE|nr:Ankyrin repeat family protein [Striga hermonthica]